MKVLVIAPLHDFPTLLSSNAVEILRKWMAERRIEYTILTWLNANRLGVELTMRLKKFDAVFYYGHGKTDRLGDFLISLIPIIDEYNIHLFKGTIIYTMSCFSGVELGKIAIQKGVRAYFGQTQKYFAFLNDLFYSYTDDWIDLINLIPKRLMLHDTCFTALKKYEAAANKLYVKYICHGNDHVLRNLFSNALYMELYGDQQAKI